MTKARSLTIDRLTVHVPGLRGNDADRFSAGLRSGLKDIAISGSDTSIERLSLPPINRRPGESAESLGRRTAYAIAEQIAGAKR